MDSFSKVEQSDRRFNITFSTVTSIVISTAITGVITYLGFAFVPYCWVAYSALILLPVITYAIARTQATSYKMAYYKKWRDKILGVLDRGKIFKDFKQKYKIDSLKAKTGDLKADGRWRFKVSTAHVRGLITEKNTILLHLENERIHEEELLDETIERQSNILENEKTENRALDDKAKARKELLNKANGAGAVFNSRLNYEEALKELSESNKRINDATYELNLAKRRKDLARENFENAVKRTKDYYYLRYQNYTSSAIKTINMVNGLKYKIDDMVEEK